jgi:hypothetical protein
MRLPAELGDGAFDIGKAGDWFVHQFQREVFGRNLRRLQRDLGSRITLDEHDSLHGGSDFVEQIDPFGAERRLEVRQAGEVATGMREAGKPSASADMLSRPKTNRRRAMILPRADPHSIR